MGVDVKNTGQKCDELKRDVSPSLADVSCDVYRQRRGGRGVTLSPSPENSAQQKLKLQLNANCC